MSAPRIDALSRLLDDGFRLWWRGLRWTAPLALLGALPSLRRMLALPTLAELQADPEGASLAVIEPLMQSGTWLWWGFSALMGLWLAGAQLRILDGLLHGEPPQALRSLGVATLRLPLLALSTSLYLVACALPLLPLLAFNAWLGLQGLELVPTLLLSMLGSLLAVLPIAWIAVRLLFLPVAAALEGLGPLRGLQRSRAMVAGQWWRLLVFLSIPLTVYGVAAAAAMALPLTLATFLRTEAAALLGTLAGLLTSALGIPMLYACLVCAYRERSAPQGG